MGDPVKIAASLAPTLQRALLELNEHPQMKPISWCVRYGYRLEEAGLAKRTLLTDRSFLTPLGPAVRRELEREQSK